MQIIRCFSVFSVLSFFGLLAGNFPVFAETTQCKEINVLPITITKSGIYCLKKNITTSTTTSPVIEINASDVVLDLNGYRLKSKAPNQNKPYAIEAINKKRITLKNGTIIGFDRGVSSTGNKSSEHKIQNLRISRTSNYPILSHGSNNIIENNSVNIYTGTDYGNGVGIAVIEGKNTSIRNNFVTGGTGINQSIGILVNDSTMVEVLENSIIDMSSSNGKISGIGIFISSNVSALGNRILNESGTGTIAIDAAGASTTTCIDNIISGYKTKVNDCSLSVDNH